MTHILRRWFGPFGRAISLILGALALGVLLAACGGEEQAEPTAAPPNDNFAQSSLTRGQAAPDFTLPTSDGATVSLSDYTNAKQPVLLFFHMADG